MKPTDYSLYLVTDKALSLGRSTSEIVEAAVRGGVDVVQLREKDCTTRQFLREAESIRAFLKSQGVALIINDRIDIAMAIGADGVHLGQKDMPLAMARCLAGPSLTIGISAESVSDAIEAQRGGADYIGVSPVFKTPTKTDTGPALGLAGVREIRAAVNIPIVGIGGLSHHNAADVIQCGADGIAVVSAIVSAPDPELAARTLKQTIKRAKVSCA